MWHTGPTLTTNDLKSINTPTLVLIGDDEPIDLKHSVALYESLPQAQFAVIPGASHGALQEKPKIYGHLVAEFLSNPSNPITQDPIRRR
jgi:pimeloyl-ACP methyl ester carboxylesterase